MAKNTMRGFTLIELLVVIAIIGILSSIVLASLNTARMKGRDAKWVADIKSLQSALELYYDANNGYPTTDADGDSIANTLTGLVSGNYIGALPVDPSGGTAAYGYYSDGSTYALGAMMEQTGQTTALANDWDGSQAMTINGVTDATTNCNANAGGANEAVFCAHQ